MLKRYGYVSTSPAAYCCAYVNDTDINSCSVFEYGIFFISDRSIQTSEIGICRERVWKVYNPERIKNSFQSCWIKFS